GQHPVLNPHPPRRASELRSPRDRRHRARASARRHRARGGRRRPAPGPVQPGVPAAARRRALVTGAGTPERLPDQPARPAEPTEAAEAAEPTEPIGPAESTQPTQPTGPDAVETAATPSR